MNQVSPYQQPGIVRICCVSHLESETVSREREREREEGGERERWEKFTAANKERQFYLDLKMNHNN